MSISRVVSSINAQLLLAYSDSQARRTKKLVEENNIEEILRGIDIQDIGLQDMIVANLRSKEISNVWNLIFCDRQKLLSDPQIGPSGLAQIDEQLGFLGLTIPEPLG